MKEVNFNVVAQNRAPISTMGSMLGKKYFQAETRVYDPDYKKVIAEAAKNGNGQLTLNRTPNRYCITSTDILNVSIEPGLVTGTTVLQINRREDGTADITIPVDQNMAKYSEVTREAIREALNGDKSKIFANPEKLAAVLNELNNIEIQNLEAVKAICDKAIQQCRSAISANDKKVQTYISEIEDSTVVHVASAPSVIVDVHHAED